MHARPISNAIALAQRALAALALLAWAGLAGCASGAPNTATGPAAAASAPARSASAPSLPQPGQPPAFATVIKDAKESKALFNVWQREERVWLELKPEDFNTPFFLSPKLARGIGESWFVGGSMLVPGSLLEERLVEFRRVHNTVQLVAVNTEFLVRDPKSPEARALAASFSPSLLASVAVASLPHPERKSVLIDAAPLLVGEMFGLGNALQRAYRQNYSLEGRNTGIASVRGSDAMVVFNINAHYHAGSLSAAPPGAPPGFPVPTLPRTLPDARSMVLGLHVSLSRPPAQPMRPRIADARVGAFASVVHDFSDDLTRSPKRRYVQRWRLEKKDPAAELSEPVQPITYWLDANIPLRYRDAVARGILEWNKAFERIGFKDAIAVKVQPEDADFDTLDVNRASVRWMINAQAMFGAIGPSHVDPRSGEILDADIGIESLSSRSIRSARSQILVASAAPDWRALLQLPRYDGSAEPGHEGHAHAQGEVCRLAELAAGQLSYALDVLAARGEIDPAGPEAEQFVLDYLTNATMHEVGHTLGLRHNFRASRVRSERELSDREFTSAHALAGSVMEYLPINLPRPGEQGGAPFQTTLGEYDYWVIEYLYKPFHPDHEAAELKRIAARNSEPALAYASDEDVALGMDPEALQMDLGDDPVAFAEKRIAIARDLIARQESRSLDPDGDYAVLRRSVHYAVLDAAQATGILARQIGGVRTLRDHPGSGRDPLQPNDAATQRRALDVLARGVLAADAFTLSPALKRRLAPDFAERAEALYGGEGFVATDYPITFIVLGLQRALLGYLMSDGLAHALLENEGKSDRAATSSLRLGELYSRLTGEVWAELGRGADIALARRELQRDHLGRLTNALLRPNPASRADARSQLRVQAQGLLTRMQAALRAGGLSAEIRAHLADSAESLAQALAARPLRAGV